MLFWTGHFSCQNVQGGLAIQAPVDAIRLNQVAFSPNQDKVAVIVGGASAPFFLLDGAGDTVFRGSLGPSQLWDASEEWAATADFSALQAPGNYRLEVPSMSLSDSLTIREGVYLEVTRSLIRSMYFQRNSEALPAAFAGEWTRSLGHPDTSVVVHPSAATEARPAGERLPFPGGWYDAGDYGKYTGPTSFVSWSLFHLLEMGGSWTELELNIPESGNELPDLLDEALVGMRFLLSLQDPSGAMPHKLTELKHPGTVMPEAALDERYLIGLGTSATLRFAAAAAAAARVLRTYESSLPGLSSQCLQAAEQAWAWAVDHPEELFTNPSDVHTGEYKDTFLEDEWAWASTELWLSTQKDMYLQANHLLEVVKARSPFYGDVSWKAMLSLALHVDRLSEEERRQWREQCYWQAGRMQEYVRTTPYQVPLGFKENDFNWGSNAIHARMGLWMLMSETFVPTKNFQREAASVGDYILGKNALDLCMITGMGVRSPQDIHHRPSKADNVLAPVPGLMVGGPQHVVKMQDCDNYPSQLPALRYVDHWCSYTTNEVAINWNATAWLLFAWLHRAME